jgi:hypothetical protein
MAVRYGFFVNQNGFGECPLSQVVGLDKPLKLISCLLFTFAATLEGDLKVGLSKQNIAQGKYYHNQGDFPFHRFPTTFVFDTPINYYLRLVDSVDTKATPNGFCS